MPDDKLPSINDWDDSKELPSVDDFLKEEVEEESLFSVSSKSSPTSSLENAREISKDSETV